MKRSVIVAAAVLVIAAAAVAPFVLGGSEDPQPTKRDVEQLERLSSERDQRIAAIAEQAVEDDLARQRPLLREACWPLATRSGPKAIRLFVSVAFDENGRQVGLAISDDRRAAQPLVSQCVRDEIESFALDPLDRAVRAEAVLRLP